MNLKTFVVPVAGRGKRLWPLTLTKPKSLVEVGGKSLFDYTIQEGIDAGYTRAIVVVGPDQEKAFGRAVDLWKTRVPSCEFELVVQDKPMGTGDALWRAADLAKKEAVAMRYPDDLLVGEPSALKLLKETYEKEGKPTLLVQEVSWEKAASCGVVESAKEISPGVYSFSGIQEQIRNKAEGIEDRKPVSNLAVMGAYVFPPDVFDYLAKERKVIDGKDDCLPINIVFPPLMEKYGFLAVKFSGKRFDCGNLQGLKDAGDYIKSQN